MPHGSIENELLERIAAMQPEMAPRLARHLSQHPTSCIKTYLASEESLAEAVNLALAKGFDDEHVISQRNSLSLSARSQPPTGLATKWLTLPPEASQLGHDQHTWARPEAAIVKRANDPPISELEKRERELALTLQKKVAVLQPEMAARITQHIYSLGSTVVHECLECDWSLQHQVDGALVALFEAEAAAANECEDQPTFNTGSGHVLPGDSPVRAMVPQIETLKPPQGSMPQLSTSRECHGSNKISVHSSGANSLHEKNHRMQQYPVNGNVEEQSTTQIASTNCRVWGLQEFLESLNLAEYIEPAAKWATDMGAAFIEEIVECSEELADALELKPLEKRRLQRQGPQVAAELVQKRSRGAGARSPNPSHSSGVPSSGSTMSQFSAPSDDTVPSTGLWHNKLP